MLELVEREGPRDIGVSRVSEEDGRRRRDRAVDAELVLRMAPHLPPQERALVEMVFRDGQTVSTIARARGEDPRPLRSRLRRLVARLQSPAFRFVLLRRGRWTRAQRSVAEACFLEGLSVRQAARALRRSQHAVRRQRDAVLALLDGEGV